MTTEQTRWYRLSMSIGTSQAIEQIDPEKWVEFQKAVGACALQLLGISTLHIDQPVLTTGISADGWKP